MFNEDCFAYSPVPNKAQRCRALKECKCFNCHFYKTKEQYLHDEAESKRKAIKKGYYAEQREYKPNKEVTK